MTDHFGIAAKRLPDKYERNQSSRRHVERNSAWKTFTMLDAEALPRDNRKITVIFVPRTFMTPKHYITIIRLLEDLGLRANAVELPSVGLPPSSDDLESDIAAIRAAIQTECEARRGRRKEHLASNTRLHIQLVKLSQSWRSRSKPPHTKNASTLD